MSKPRICEVLRVEVNQSFQFNDFPFDEVKSYLVGPDGKIRNVHGGEVTSSELCYIINHSDYIIREPRWTEQEVEIVKNLLEVVGPAELRKVADMVTMKVDGKIIYLRKDAFPSLKNEMVVTLYEIIGGAE